MTYDLQYRLFISLLFVLIMLIITYVFGFFCALSLLLTYFSFYVGYLVLQYCTIAAKQF